MNEIIYAPHAEQVYFDGNNCFLQSSFKNIQIDTNNLGKFKLYSCNGNIMKPHYGRNKRGIFLQWGENFNPIHLSYLEHEYIYI